MTSKRIAFIFIFCTVLVDIIGIGIIIPVIPNLILELTGLGISEASAYGGGLMISFALMQFLFSPILGEMSDRFGRRPVLLIALLGLSIDYVLHAVAPSILWLFAGRVLAGICGASYTVANAYIADISAPEERAKNFGMLGAAFGLGFIIGPAIGGFFGEIDIRLPFYIAAGLTFVNFLIGVFFVPESLPKEKRRPMMSMKMIPGVSLASLGRYAGIGGLILALFFANIAGQTLPAIWSFFTIEMYSWSQRDIGISLMVVGIFVSIVQGGLVGPLVKKLGQTRVIIIGFSLWTFGMLLFAFASEGWMLYAFLVPYALGGMAGPTLQGVLSNQVSESEQGNLQGALTSMISLTTIIGPAIATFLFYTFTGDEVILYFPGASFVAGAVLLFVSTLVVLSALKKMKHID